MNINEARRNMISQQIRSARVTDERVIELLSTVGREYFVPIQFEKMAFADMALPLAHHQQMWLPCEEAMALQVLNIQPEDKILEVGTGSGYLTALMAKLGKHVFSVDIFAEFTNSASAKLKQFGCHNVSLLTGDAAESWPEYVPYDVIIVTGSVPYLPDQFKQHLTVGGRIFAIIGTTAIKSTYLITQIGKDEWQKTSLFEMHCQPLVDAVYPEQFDF